MRTQEAFTPTVEGGDQFRHIPEMLQATSDFPHPSEFIAEELIARGWSADDLALRMSDGTDHDYGICRIALDLYEQVGPGEPNMLMGGSTSAKLGKAFDVSPDYFLKLEEIWRRSFRQEHG